LERVESSPKHVDMSSEPFGIVARRFRAASSCKANISGRIISSSRAS
jgi:hypothetical protein